METIKVVLIDDSGVGKTSIIQRYVNDEYDPNLLLSSSAQFITKTNELNDEQSFKFDVWDTAEQEKFRPLDKIVYKDTRAIILVYDIINRISFEQLQNYWFKEIEENSLSDVILEINLIYMKMNKFLMKKDKNMPTKKTQFLKELLFYVIEILIFI